MIYTYTFSKPFSWEDKTYKSLTFDFDKLTGRDTGEIEEIVLRRGHLMPALPENSSEFMAIAAARACEDDIGDDLMWALPMRAFNQITRELRLFLIRPASPEKDEENGSESNA